MKPETSDLIRKLIQEFLAEPQDTTHMKELQEAVKKYGVLPIAFVWDPVCLSPSGEIVAFIWDDLSNPIPQNDPKNVNAYLFRGIKKYPELIDLMPMRGNEDIECDSCSGTGVSPIAEKIGRPDDIICSCGGLGWVPKNSN